MALKILLLGEFSALHKNLKEGLVELGHDVTIASSGDGWKKIDADLNLGAVKSGLVGRLLAVTSLVRALPKLIRYDVVQFVSPVVFPRFMGINRILVNYIFKFNKKVFLVGAGATSNTTLIADFLEKKYKYPQFYKEIKKISPDMWSQTPKGRDYNKWFFSKIDGYIPIMYEYAEGYRNAEHIKLCPTVPIPINIDKVIYQDNLVKGKVIIFHGLNREGDKGTPLIREAMMQLQRNYPDEVECVIDGKMPLDTYLDFLRRVNVVIDQAYSVSAGVNGVYNLAMGKVVLGGGESEFLKEFNLEKSPLIPIRPDVADIYSKLEWLVKNKAEISSIGYESRQFAVELHAYIKVAQQYLDIWQNNTIKDKRHG
ncbi:hypothetical protein [Rheinheimera sp. NSM]|uniref:hypothetical protein n=1 Tax=Rheinheimera sp. NSM TaxID=3457884 RepID=UPI00403543A4